MSHDYLERLYWIDDDLLQFFKDYLTPSFLENTLVITMGNKTKEKISLYLLNKILNILFLNTTLSDKQIKIINQSAKFVV